MFYNIKMKFLIGGKSRSIYMRKDGSAYYKSGGENVDVSYMFKKNGGGLKKQYIGGVQDNLGKVEQKKRSKKGFKQILGGAISSINFDKIEIKSEDIMTKGIYQADKAPKQLKNICCLALYGLGAAMTGELAYKADKDEIKVLVSSKKKTEFLKYLKRTPGNNAIPEGDIKPKATALGFLEYTNENIDSEEGIPVTRAYILNKILQCFHGPDSNYIADGSVEKVSDPTSLLLNDKKNIINPSTGNLNTEGAKSISEDELFQLYKNICKTSMLQGDAVKIPALNLHTVLFIEEQIGSPPAGEPAPAAEADDGGGGEEVRGEEMGGEDD